MKRDTWRLGLGLTGLRAPKKSIKSACSAYVAMDLRY